MSWVLSMAASRPERAGAAAQIQQVLGSKLDVRGRSLMSSAVAHVKRMPAAAPPRRDAMDRQCVADATVAPVMWVHDAKLQ